MLSRFVALSVSLTQNVHPQTFPSSGKTGPTSMLLRFNDADKNLGDGADDFAGYEVGISPGHVNCGWHDHDYSDLGSKPAASAVVGKPLRFHVRLEQSAQQLTFTYSIDGKVVASFVDKDKAHINSLKGADGIGLRGYNGLASFSGLKYGSS